MRDPRPEFDYNKADPRWRLVVWMGKVETSDEHIGASGSEAEKCRTVRRRPEAERWVRALFDAMTACPWGATEKMTDAAVATRRRYITQAYVQQHGATPGGEACAGNSSRHTPRCRARFEEFFKAEDEARDDRAAATPAVVADPAAEEAASAAEPGGAVAADAGVLPNEVTEPAVVAAPQELPMEEPET